jgi:hypothetical protein
MHLKVPRSSCARAFFAPCFGVAAVGACAESGMPRDASFLAPGSAPGGSFSSVAAKAVAAPPDGGGPNCLAFRLKPTGLCHDGYWPRECYELARAAPGSGLRVWAPSSDCERRPILPYDEQYQKSQSRVYATGSPWASPEPWPAGLTITLVRHSTHERSPVDYVVNIYADGRVLFQSFNCSVDSLAVHVKRLSPEQLGRLLEQIRGERLIDDFSCESSSDAEILAVALSVDSDTQVVFGTIAANSPLTRSAQLIDGVVGTSEWLRP